jgi:hypothetical protein
LKGEREGIEEASYTGGASRPPAIARPERSWETLREPGSSPSRTGIVIINEEFIMRFAVRSVVTVVGVVVLAAQLAGQAKPDFSGTWTMVADKSDFGPMPAPASMTRTITHKDPVLKVVIVQTGGPMGDTTIETNFTTDGKPQQNTVSGNPMTTVAKWDGAAITLHTNTSQQGVDILLDDRYELSNAGKTLTITRKITTPDEPFTITIVFAKKPGA